MTQAVDGRIGELAHEVVGRAGQAGLTLGCAESCTGGLVSGALTAVPGSSAVVLGGVVSYAISIKRKLLGVDGALFEDPSIGAVSQECALQMSVGAARLLGCDIAVSVTGIAGPSGAEPGKPVGTVWFGICARGRQRAVLKHFDGMRTDVRNQAVCQALQLMLEEIMEICHH